MENIWSGRMDGEDVLSQRLFQKVKSTQDYNSIKKDNFFIHGFAVDEGVKRNKGRVGAALAPNRIRKSMSNFPVILPQLEILDFGNIDCEGEDLEKAQNQLAIKVAEGLKRNGRSIVLGGGHELMYAHFSGIRKAFPNQKIGIINFDAHFDNRVPENGKANSGTGFWQIAQQEKLHSLHIGIQRNSNTQQLFRIANNLGMKYMISDELFESNLPALSSRIDQFISEADLLYCTICMDVFNSAIAPGVSAVAYNGIFADHTFLTLLRKILGNEKLVALDVAEVNPNYDIQEHTSKLAASLINEWLML